MNDPDIFRRRRIQAVIRDEVARSPGDPWSAAKRAHARLSDDPALRALITLAALEASARLEARALRGVRDEDGGWRSPPDGAA
jgi:hypothetical protein